MPRITSRIIREAMGISPLLPPLLKANRYLEGAKQELEWIKKELPKDKWRDAVIRRSKLEPLQYILGSQPFGDLDILCRKGVLIPRWETEEWTNLLADQLIEKYQNQRLSIIDACTGSGCIPLLLNHRLAEEGITAEVEAFDVSDTAYELAWDNLKSYEKSFRRGCSNIKISKGDLLTSTGVKHLLGNKPDLVVSNPPYIPIQDYYLPLSLNGVERSVRQYEPKLALVGENEFYIALLENLVLSSGAKGFVFELGYREQADCVAEILNNREAGKWETGTFRDTQGNIRCSIGWLKESPMSILRNLCN